MISIKNASREELHIIHSLAHQIWPDAYADILTPGQLEYMLEKIYSLPSLEYQFAVLQHNFLIVLDNDVPVGFASFSPKENNSEDYRLHKIYLLPRLQGTGTGKLLLQHILDSIRSSGGSSLELNVNRYNMARHFYEKMGFQITDEVDIEIGQGYFMNDYIMKLKW